MVELIDRVDKIESHSHIRPKKPPLYKVIIHNDDFTEFGFVEYILIKRFNKSVEDAELLAQNIHDAGIAIIAIYTKDIAETKINQVDEEANHYEFPLRLTLEEE